MGIRLFTITTQVEFEDENRDQAVKDADEMADVCVECIQNLDWPISIKGVEVVCLIETPGGLT